MDLRACLFDVFGTVVDWRTSVSRDLAAFAKQKGLGGIDWLEFAVEWRKLYQPSMDEVRSGRRAVHDPRRAAPGEPGQADRALRHEGPCRRPTSST